MHGDGDPFGARLLRRSRVLLGAWSRLPPAVRWLPCLSAMALLWWLSSMPARNAAPSVWRELLHNGAHVVAYAGLAIAALLAMRPAPGTQPRQPWLAVAIAVGYGIVDEVHQGFVPGRHPSIGDLLSDASGALLGVVLLRGVVDGHAPSRVAVPWLLLLAASSVALENWVW